MTFETSPAPTGAISTAVDIFAPQPVPQSASLPKIETVSDNDDNPRATTEKGSIDPFADANLLGGLTDTPLAALEMNSQKFEHNGNQLSSLKITTAEFGQKWGSCHSTSPAHIPSSSIGTLEKFMEAIEKIGAHKVEAIAATNEGICAGQIGGSVIALIHGKVSPLGGQSAKLDVTIKSNDATMGGVLAMFIQNTLK